MRKFEIILFKTKHKKNVKFDKMYKLSRIQNNIKILGNI